MRKIFIAIIIMIVSSNSFGIVFGGSNLGFLGYDEHSCTKPYRPTEPYSFDSQWAIDNYNNEVDQYNYEQELYVSCIKKYVENAQNDIKRIGEAIDDAIDEANEL
jgi:hypothetical protein|tara:strand:+ start:339 stop:653 length:315 start_codon:yes stop_codon:yes gene_type:complete